jgi:hypothetical protein
MRTNVVAKVMLADIKQPITKEKIRFEMVIMI